MPIFSSVHRTGKADSSTSRMISSFSEAGYLMRRPPLQLRPAPGTGLESQETGSQNQRYSDSGQRQRPHAQYLNRGNARILRAILQRPGNAGSYRTAGWAREDSNLQPDRYERSTLTVELRAR